MLTLLALTRPFSSKGLQPKFLNNLLTSHVNCCWNADVSSWWGSTVWIFWFFPQIHVTNTQVLDQNFPISWGQLSQVYSICSIHEFLHRVPLFSHRSAHELDLLQGLKIYGWSFKNKNYHCWIFIQGSSSKF